MSLFQTHYQEPYKLYTRHVAQCIVSGSTIVDLGCDVGVLADLVERVSHGCTIHCVDMNAAALATLASKARNYASTTVQCYHADANTFLQRDDIRDINLVVVHAALHEINAVENQRGYLELFFARALHILAEQGKIFIGDFFYPPRVARARRECLYGDAARQNWACRSTRQICEPGAPARDRGGKWIEGTF